MAETFKHTKHISIAQTTIRLQTWFSKIFPIKSNPTRDRTVLNNFQNVIEPYKEDIIIWFAVASRCSKSGYTLRPLSRKRKSSEKTRNQGCFFFAWTRLKQRSAIEDVYCSSCCRYYLSFGFCSYPLYILCEWNSVVFIFKGFQNNTHSFYRMLCSCRSIIFMIPVHLRIFVCSLFHVRLYFL